ncbi:hypothetical protein [Nocardioides marmoribigeumensis]|uniref:Uncharacterized protein n=1 Tax=Nocardioides marmoribigeumensis TaxID=433649 RepID=A0ABU2BRX0_9ACTN|nr:hypothetical protein [Nocardioides marmoribigeumensis]MDR7361368.1 hypothetical protein [Nocardioides marmoribigeumensis]
MSVTADYEDLVELVRAYGTFAARFGAKSVIKVAKAGGAFHEVKAMRSPYSRPEGLITLYEKLATEEERIDPNYESLQSGQPFEHLAARFMSSHPGLTSTDAAAIAELHRLHWDRHSETSWRRTVAAVIAIAAFAGQFFTAEVFKTMHWTGYGTYRTALAFGTLLAAAYLSMMILTLSSATRRSAPVRDVELVIVLVTALVHRAESARARPTTQGNE